MPSVSNRLNISFLVAAMLVTGVANTLLSKYQDQQCVRNCNDPNPGRHETFKQPVIQTAQMFIGESACWVVFRGTGLLSRRFAGSERSRGYTVIPTTDTHETPGTASGITSGPAGSPTSAALWPIDDAEDDDTADQPNPRIRRVLLLAVPTMLDICGTTFNNAGLLFTTPSVYQMTRGLVVLFVASFSLIFFRRQLHQAEFLGVIGVVLGVAIVGVSGVLADSDATPDTYASSQVPRDFSTMGTIIGVLLVAFAQIFTASQLIVEESILDGCRFEPIDVVGCEGFLGIVMMTTILPPLNLAGALPGQLRLGPLDIVEGWRQLTMVKHALVSGILITISVGLFNFSGLAVTKQLSATSRATIDTSRTFFIWIFSLGLGWESFSWLQLGGFLVLLYSTLLFHGIVELPGNNNDGVQARGGS